MHKSVLYGCFRSSASYRVCIALNLSGIEHETDSVNLLENAHRGAGSSGAQSAGSGVTSFARVCWCLNRGTQALIEAAFYR
jgi:hypothetical protein